MFTSAMSSQPAFGFANFSAMSSLTNKLTMYLGDSRHAGCLACNVILKSCSNLMKNSESNDDHTLTDLQEHAAVANEDEPDVLNDILRSIVEHQKETDRRVKEQTEAINNLRTSIDTTMASLKSMIQNNQGQGSSSVKKRKKALSPEIKLLERRRKARVSPIQISFESAVYVRG